MNADSANKAHLEEVREGGGHEEEKPKFNMDTLTSFYNSSDNQLGVEHCPKEWQTSKTNPPRKVDEKGFSRAIKPRNLGPPPQHEQS